MKMLGVIDRANHCCGPLDRGTWLRVKDIARHHVRTGRPDRQSL